MQTGSMSNPIQARHGPMTSNLILLNDTLGSGDRVMLQQTLVEIDQLTQTVVRPVTSTG